VCLGFWIPAGSRDESPSEAGTTHLIEHLLFKGSQKYTAEEIAQIFDSLGGELNAATSREYVVVYGRFLDVHLERAMDVLVDMLLCPRFTDLDREREVVLEEIAMYEDSPQDLIHDLTAETVFGTHPLGHRVLGSTQTISTMLEADIRGYHDRHFRFSDMVVAAAGRIDHEHLRGLLLAEHGENQSGNVVRVDELLGGAPKRAFFEKETEQMHVCLGGAGIKRTDERRYILSVTDSLLGGSLSSRLFQEVREKRGLAYSIYSFSSMYRETGMCGVYFGCRPDRVGQVTEVVAAELRRLCTELVPDDELARAKEHLKGRVILGLESTSSRMTRLGKAVLMGTEIYTLDEIAARIDAVTAEDVRALSEQVFSVDSLSVIGLGVDRSVFDAAVPPEGLSGIN
jgi:predicted Zn-dependent peptidase